MADRTGRLDLLLLGIVERIASRDPVYLAVYQMFEPELREMLKPLDSPRLRRAVKSLAEGQRQTAPKRRQMAGARKATGVRSAVTVTAADGKAEIVEAEWIQ
jgi:hypothetical protein